MTMRETGYVQKSKLLSQLEVTRFKDWRLRCE